MTRDINALSCSSEHKYHLQTLDTENEGDAEEALLGGLFSQRSTPSVGQTTHDNDSSSDDDDDGDDGGDGGGDGDGDDDGLDKQHDDKENIFVP